MSSPALAKVWKQRNAQHSNGNGEHSYCQMLSWEENHVRQGQEKPKHGVYSTYLKLDLGKSKTVCKTVCCCLQMPGQHASKVCKRLPRGLLLVCVGCCLELYLLAGGAVAGGFALSCRR